MIQSDLFIIAAGNGTRLGSSTPKALTPIKGIPCITNTLQQIGNKFNFVYLVTNENAQTDWIDYLELLETPPEILQNVVNIPIKSGLGDGDAVWKALLRTPITSSTHATVVWGDVYFKTAEIVDELLSDAHFYGAGFIPCVTEENPYVQIVTKKADVLGGKRDVCTHAALSKNGDTITRGYHDQSIFLFEKNKIYRALNALHSCLFKDNKYMAPRGELSLLYAFHYLANSCTPLIAYETKYPTLTFNTPEELQQIEQQL